MLAGVAKRTAGEFFTAVDRELSGLVPVAAAPAPVTAVPTAATPAAAAPAAGVWTRPAPVRDPVQQRIRDLMLGAAFGAVIALLGVLIGAIVAGW
jgi:hypothetical protein